MTQIEQKLAEIIQILYRSKICVEEFQEGSQVVLNDYLNAFVRELEALNKSAVLQASVPIPLEVIQLVDEGKNPDTFTEKRLDDASARLQVTRGKIAALEQFKKSLLREVGASLPDALAQYNAR